jgi:hypothetical protein
MAFEHLIKQNFVGEIPLDKLARKYCVAMAGREIVQHHDSVSALSERLYNVTAYVSGTAGNKYRFH